MSTVMLKLSV